MNSGIQSLRPAGGRLPQTGSERNRRGLGLARSVDLEPAHPHACADRASIVGTGNAVRPVVWRRRLFRLVRILATAGVVGGAGAWVAHLCTSAASERAYINAEMTVLRAPISGQLQLEALQPGSWIPRGAAVFRIENPRFGNQDVVAQLNAVQELTERLRAEAGEAEVRCRQQEAAFRLHQKLHEERLISNLAFIEEETKLALAQTALTNKQAQVRLADARAREVARQVELQKEAIVQMPFDGVAWTIPARPGAQIAAHEAVLQVIDPERLWVDAFFHERHARKLRAGARVNIQSLDGRERWPGRVESVRGGVGRIPYDEAAADASALGVRRRVAVRVRMESTQPYGASQFYGVGRSVVVTVNSHE